MTGDGMSEVEMQVAIARLTQMVESGFAVTARELSEIKAEVKRTNGRVTSLELVDAARTAGNKATAEAEARSRGESPVVTWDTAKTFAQFGGWVIAGGFGLAKLIEWVATHLPKVAS